MPHPRKPKAPLRADARRNRDAIVHAARAVFAEEGLDAPLERVVRRAGVGRGTLYRRFPSREDLLFAIHEDNLDALEAVAESAADRDRAFVEVLVAAKEILAADRGFGELLRRHPVSPQTAQRVSDRFLTIIEEPLRRAQRAGDIRDDLRPDDALLILDMVGGAAVADGPHRAPDRAGRALALVLDAVTPPRRAHRPG